MFRISIICMPLLLAPVLLAPAVAAADEAVAPETVPHQGSTKKEHPKVQADTKKQSVAEGTAKDGAKAEADVKMSGMSILGNEDAPKSLVIVPWKSSQLGDMPGISKLLNDSTQPVDKDVFMRELAYYQFRSNSK